MKNLILILLFSLALIPLTGCFAMREVLVSMVFLPPPFPPPPPEPDPTIVIIIDKSSPKPPDQYRHREIHTGGHSAISNPAPSSTLPRSRDREEGNIEKKSTRDSGSRRSGR
jgi:hypothetical protein